MISLCAFGVKCFIPTISTAPLVELSATQMQGKLNPDQDMLRMIWIKYTACDVMTRWEFLYVEPVDDLSKNELLQLLESIGM